MFTIPGTLYRRYGRYLVVPILLVTAIAFVLVGGVSFRSGFSLFLPPDDPYRQLDDQVQETFSQDNLIIVALDVDSLIAPEDLVRIAEVSERAMSIEGTASVVSLANLEDLYLEGDALERRAIYRPDEDPRAKALSERVLGTPLFREFFISRDGQAIYTYVIPDPEVVPAEYGGALVAELDAADLHFFGDAIAKAYVSRSVMEELVLLGALALAVVLLVEIIVSRSLIIGVVLSVVSMVPAVWTLALFPLLGNAVETTTMMVPVIVLVLATSYGIHIYRYHALGLGDMGSTLEHVAPVVIAAGLTTVIGFLSLLVTPSRILTQLGTLIIFGVSAALVTSFLLLPPILEPLTKRLRERARSRIAREPLERVTHFLSKPAMRPGLRLLLIGIAVATLAAFIPSVRGGYSARDTFRPQTDISQAVSYFQTRAGATHDMELYLDTGEEYGLVYLSTYEQLKAMEAALEADESIARSISYIDFVEFMLGRLDGRVEPIAPISDAEVGEAMELLSGEGVGLNFGALVDTNWQQTRLLMQAEFPSITNPAGIEAVESLLSRVRELLDASPELRSNRGRREVTFVPPGFERAAILGVPVENLQHIRYLTRSQVISLLAFAPFIVGFLILVFRSVKWAILSLTPTLVGVLVYFGVLGLSGFLHDPIHVFMVAALMGIANDDVLYFILVFRRERDGTDFAPALSNTVHKTGAAIVQTTVILIAGVATFFFSRFVLLGRSAFVVITGLIAATTTTLVVIPAVLQITPALRRGARRRNGALDRPPIQRTSAENSSD